MAKKILKRYSVNATVFYVQEATASYTIMASDDKAALKQIREILNGRTAITRADSFDNVDKPFNISGSFTLARGDDIPADEDDEAIVVCDESFGGDT